MPLEKYFKGHGRDVMKQMVDHYGEKKGKQVFYALVSKEKKGKKRG